LILPLAPNLWRLPLPCPLRTPRFFDLPLHLLPLQSDANQK
jgi:hypothetical protein